jgi:glycerol-3-phosphate acyltransferase PlsY
MSEKIRAIRCKNILPHGAWLRAKMQQDNVPFPRVIEPVHKLYHLLGGLFFPFLCYYVSRAAVIATLLCMASVVCFLDASRFISERIRIFEGAYFNWLSPLFRGEEARRISGTTYYFVGAAVTAILYTREIAVLALVFLAVGDVAAPIVGGWWGRVDIFGKSIEGAIGAFLACVGAGFLAALLTRLDLSPRMIVAGALAATVVGHLPLRVNDNLTIPVVSGLVMAWMTA